MYTCGGDIPVLEGTRVRLRRMERKDAPVMLEYWSDPEVTRHLIMPRFDNQEEVWGMIDLLNGLSESEDTIRWGIELKSEGRLIGSAGYNVWELTGAWRGEIGYDLGKRYWGQGYMKEALGLVLSFGYDTMGLNRIEALVSPENGPSLSLLRVCGFREEGLLREYQKTPAGFQDLLMYSLLKREYEMKHVNENREEPV